MANLFSGFGNLNQGRVLSLSAGFGGWGESKEVNERSCPEIAISPPPTPIPTGPIIDRV
jgi:hypothetical protein